jgi:hypothetical protein
MIYVTIQPEHHCESGTGYSDNRHTSEGNLDADIDKNEGRKEVYILQCKYLSKVIVFTLALLPCRLSYLSQALFEQCERRIQARYGRNRPSWLFRRKTAIKRTVFINAIPNDTR